MRYLAFLWTSYGPVKQVHAIICLAELWLALLLPCCFAALLCGYLAFLCKQEYGFIQI